LNTVPALFSDLFSDSKLMKPMPTAGSASAAGNIWDMSDLGQSLMDGHSGAAGGASGSSKKKTAEEFLGQNANLVNLNDLISRPPPSSRCIFVSLDAKAWGALVDNFLMFMSWSRTADL
jgi:hypothetical protein